ncbi:MAG: STAS domain-containing protein [Planctomycetota bacterium]
MAVARHAEQHHRSGEGRFATLENAGHALIVKVRGPSLSDEDAAGVLAQVAGHVDRCGGRVVLDLTGVEFMVSAGISMVLELRERCHAAGGQLAVCGLARPIASVLHSTRVDRLVVVARTSERAARKIA